MSDKSLETILKGINNGLEQLNARISALEKGGQTAKATVSEPTPEVVEYAKAVTVLLDKDDKVVGKIPMPLPKNTDRYIRWSADNVKGSPIIAQVHLRRDVYRFTG